MATFKERVEAYTGSILDTTALSGWLTSGARNILAMVPLQGLTQWGLSTEVGAPPDTFNLGDNIFLTANLNGYECKTVGEDMRARVLDINSVYFATSTSPVIFIDPSGNVQVAPSGGTLWYVPSPDVQHDDSVIFNFPVKLDQAVVLHAAIQGLGWITAGELVSLGSSFPVLPDFTTQLAAAALAMRINEDIDLGMGIMKEIESTIITFNAALQRYTTGVDTSMKNIQLRQVYKESLQKEFQSELTMHGLIKIPEKIPEKK